MFKRLVQAYLRPKRWEVQTPLYRWLGITSLDRVLARLFGDPQIVKYSPGAVENFARLRTAFYQGQYADVVNVMSFLIYVTFLICAIWAGVPWLAWYSVFTGSIHLVTILIERSKRAALVTWWDHPEALEAPAPEMPPVRSISEIQRPFFAPAKFESQEFYEKLWIVDSFRKFVFWLASLSNLLPGDTESTHNTLQTRSAAAIDAFEKNTRTAEVIHLIGIAQHIPYWVVFIQLRFWPGMIYMLWPMYLNVGAWLLQRQHRARVFKILLRFAGKAQASARQP